MITEMANDYSDFMKVDMKKQLGPLEETIEDMLTRLEEFESLVAMVQQAAGESVGPSGTVPSVAECRNGLTEICARTDALERLVERVSSNLDVLETRVANAETELGAGEPNKLKSLFKPFFRKSSDPKSPVGNTSNIETFKADDYFPK